MEEVPDNIHMQPVQQTLMNELIPDVNINSMVLMTLLSESDEPELMQVKSAAVKGNHAGKASVSGAKESEQWPEDWLC